MVDDGTSELIPRDRDAVPYLELASTRLSFFQRFGLSASWRYGSANLLLLLGSASILAGGWVPWLVLSVALVLGSFADEASGDDRTALNDGTCLFCKTNLYLSLPLVCILAAMLLHFAAIQPSLTGEPFLVHDRLHQIQLERDKTRGHPMPLHQLFRVSYSREQPATTMERPICRISAEVNAKPRIINPGVFA